MSSNYTKKLSIFYVLWAGQLVSIIGTGLIGFGLGVWIFRNTGSSIYYALITLCTMLPGLLISPLAGVWSDKYSRKLMLIISNIGSITLIIVLFTLFKSQSVELWHIFTIVALCSVFNGIQFPASKALVSDLVPGSFYAQASSIMQAAYGVQFIVSPLIAGVLIGLIGIKGIIGLNVIAFGLAAITLLLIPDIKSNSDKFIDNQSIMQALKSSFLYLKQKTGLLSLISIITICNVFQGILIVLVGPMILSFSDAKTLGTCQSIAGLGMIISSLYLGIKGMNNNLIKNIFFFLIVSGIGITCAGLRSNLFLIVLSGFVFFFSSSFINTGFETILRKKVVTSMQGRVFSFTRIMVQGGLVIAFLFAGQLADKVFEPLAQSQNFLSSFIHDIIGSGKGRGIGLMFTLSGLMLIITTIIGYSLPRIRKIDAHLKDEITNEPELQLQNRKKHKKQIESLYEQEFKKGA